MTPQKISLDGYRLKPLSFSQLQKDTIVSFYYKGQSSHDSNPLVYIVEVRENRIYGFNLHYDTTTWRWITTIKKNELIDLINKELERLSALESLGVSESEINSDEVKQVILSNMPDALKGTFRLPHKKELHTSILRNYLKSNMRTMRQIIFAKRLL